MHRFIFILMSFCWFVASAQSPDPQLFQNFIPANYSLLDSASGDWNKDGYKDLVLILKNDAEEQNPDTTRPLLLLAGTADGGYTLLARNDSVVLCKGCGGVFGDPYTGVVIKNGYLSLEHYGGSSWRWTRVITFRFDPKSGQFRLHRDAGVSYHTSDPDKTTDIISNKTHYGKLLFTNYSYEMDP
jgi:hypothetical protein